MERSAGHRDIVYCHQCDNEWYRDEHGLECPACHSDFTEIVEAGHDPRTQDPLDMAHHETDHFPDPEEDDISHMDWRRHEPSNFFTYTTPGGGAQHHGNQQGFGQQQPLNPVFQSVAAIIGNIMAPRRQPGLQQPNMAGQQFQGSAQRNIAFSYPFDPPQAPPGRSDSVPVSPSRENHTTVRSGGGPNFRWQITTSFGSSRGQDARGGVAATGFGDDFDDFAHQRGRHASPVPMGMQPMVFGNMHPPAAFPFDDDAFAHLGPIGPLLASMFGPGAIIHGHGGDAVYSQEGLDRIITQLMEQHASGNAPGPATEEAITSLPQRAINEKDLGDEGKAECSICMEEVNIGEQVTELPCHHWFHGECVKAWLTEHDTCPHCRQGIMPKDDSGNGSRLRTPGEAPRHDQMWGQGEGTRDNPWVIPDSPRQARGGAGSRHSSGTGASNSRNSGSEGLFNRMRNAFGGGNHS
ncbi:hypothetical protein K461DRAFT_121591 [Myriangium duriaei CBS 260.36]|uniref:RING-type E3 ubiquitin transferase n=1 Tax=Myriangium duriaei CBS 260.36 TaxID=1168546 RepID=A0A9P4J831_9PEZI|nr:hypothetical protein K461DRAFT_121591 [Myriangium duriaei CBS 260.36]